MAINLQGTARFLDFNCDAFFTGKTFEVVRPPEQLTDYDTKKVLGAKVEIEIASDSTVYGSAGGEWIDNTGARFTVKLLGKDPREYAWAARRTPVLIENVTKASLWALADGKPRNQLTIEGEIRPVPEEESGRKK